MNQHDRNRNRQQGGSQQEAYSTQNRQQGGYESSRQPGDDYSGNRDRGYSTGSSGDWRREQDRGGYQDDQSEQGWRSRGEQERYDQRSSWEQRDQSDPYNSGRSYADRQYSPWRDDGDQSREYSGPYGQYSQYGLRDRQGGQRYGGGYDRYDQRQSDRPSGLDRDYRGAGYAGPGGYGGGFGGGNAGQDSGAYRGGGRRESEQFDPDYAQWRRDQVRALDDDYNQWREDRFKKFSDEFSTWRSNRTQRAGADKKNEAGSTPGKPNKDSNS